MTLPNDMLSTPGLAEAIAQGRFPSRKDFLSTAGSAFEALAARILPTTDTPGAG